MPTIAALIADPADRRLVLEQIGDQAVVRFCDTAEALLELAGGGGIGAVVADLHEAAGGSILPTFGELHRQMPHLPLVLFCDPTPEAARELLLAGTVLSGLSHIFRNCEHLGLALAPLLHQPRLPSAAETLARHVVPLVPPPFQPFLLVCATKASARLRVSVAARWSGSSRRTVERALRLARLPSAGAMLGSCTALHAAWWLDVQGWAPKQVVAQMGFPHSSSVIRVLRRHFGCSVKSLHAVGGFHELLYRFETSLLGSIPSTPLRSA